MKRKPKRQGWEVYCTNQRWETGGISFDPLSLVMRSPIFWKQFWVELPPQNRSTHHKAKNLFPTKSNFRATIQSHKQAEDSYWWSRWKSQAVPKWYGERPSPREAEPILVQAFQDEGRRGEQTQGCEAVGVHSSRRAVNREGHFCCYATWPQDKSPNHSVPHSLWGGHNSTSLPA